MFFTITAIGVSALQVAIGIALGLSLRKQRQRRLADYQASLEEMLTLERPDAARDGRLPADDMATVAGIAEKTIAPAVLAEVPLVETQSAVAARAAAHDDENSVCQVTIEQNDLKNRRKSRRRSFQFRQHVAPYQGGMLPGKASFREVECQDISATGFSFLCSQLPDFDAVVVALGVAPQQTYLSAQIVSRCPLHDGPAPLYRIGCRFAGPVSQ